KKYIKQLWIEIWLTSNENARKLRNIYNRPNTTDSAKLYETFSKRQHILWIAQLRTAHCPLKDYLYRFSIVNDRMYECKAENETVAHYLLKYRIYEIYIYIS